MKLSKIELNSTKQIKISELKYLLSILGYENVQVLFKDLTRHKYIKWIEKENKFIITNDTKKPLN